jgi:hypothetical protein
MERSLHMSPVRPNDRPSRRELEQLTAQVGPDLEDLFQRLGISQGEAERLLREALSRLSYQWGEVRNRSWWLLDAIETAAMEMAHPSSEDSEEG